MDMGMADPAPVVSAVAAAPAVSTCRGRAPQIEAAMQTAHYGVSQSIQVSMRHPDFSDVTGQRDHRD